MYSNMTSMSETARPVRMLFVGEIISFLFGKTVSEEVKERKLGYSEV